MSKAPTPKTTFAFVPSSSLWGKILPTFQSLRQYRHGQYCTKNGGDEGSRTPDLYVANVPLSHLSYIPTLKSLLIFVVQRHCITNNYKGLMAINQCIYEKNRSFAIGDWRSIRNIKDLTLPTVLVKMIRVPP